MGVGDGVPARSTNSSNCNALVLAQLSVALVVVIVEAEIVAGSEQLVVVKVFEFVQRLASVIEQIDLTYALYAVPIVKSIAWKVGEETNVPVEVSIGAELEAGKTKTSHSELFPVAVQEIVALL